LVRLREKNVVRSLFVVDVDDDDDDDEFSAAPVCFV
jgi:hypothetical protein